MSIVPKKEPQKVSYDIWESHTPGENKLELIDGECLWGGTERDNMLLMLVFNTGLAAFLELLPEQSKSELLELVIANIKSADPAAILKNTREKQHPLQFHEWNREELEHYRKILQLDAEELTKKAQLLLVEYALKLERENEKLRSNLEG